LPKDITILLIDKNPALGQIKNIMKAINGLTIPTGFLRILSSI